MAIIGREGLRDRRPRPPGDRLAALWKLALAYEAADWRGLAALAAPLGISPEVLPACYNAAVAWSDEVFRV